ncbi:MAG TPA: translation initiation factor IF-2 [Clostridia bacterium]|nr:translation initiation factor IF-2 [Clostridia bacterium]
MIEKDNTARKPRSEIEIKLDDIENNIFKQLKERLSSLTDYINIKRNALNSAKQLFNEKKEKELFIETKVEVIEEVEIVEEEATLDAAEQTEQLVVDTKESEQPVVLEQTEPIKTTSTVTPSPVKKPFTNERRFEPNKQFTPRTQKPTIAISPEVVKEAPKKAGKQMTAEKKKFIDDKRKLSQKTMVKKGYIQSNASMEYDEISGEIMKIRTRKSSKKQATPVVISKPIEHAIINMEIVPIKVLSERIGKSCAEILKKLFELNIIMNINDSIDFDTAELVSAELGVTLELVHEQTSEEKLMAIHIDDDPIENNENLQERPPIVTIMGHVDHGKTSILDYIRKSTVATGEAGGITQHIGAYTVKVNGKQITFLDTPGHEAFTAMRARGADVTDIVVIVVAADDGIMPQTIEAINHAKAAPNVNIIVAINKMDKQTANPDRILQQLADNNLLVEDWGGTIPAIRVSAKSGMGMSDLLETIALTAEVMELKANPNRGAKGTIIEAKLDKGKGPVATVLVQNGTLETGDFIVAGTIIGRVRAMFDDKGKQVNFALPSTPVSVLGLQEVPNAGDPIMTVKDEKLSKQVVGERKEKEKFDMISTYKTTWEDLSSKMEEGKLKDLNIILKADVQGSEEALKQSLLKLSNDEVKVHIVHSGVGAINESDVSLASTSAAIIIGFNIRPDSNARNLAEKNNISVKLYRVIYDAINDVTAVIKGLQPKQYVETYFGRAEVRQIFRISDVGTIAGCMVKDGKIARNCKARLLRDSVVITETNISSLKRMKDDVKEVASGYDCGIGLDKYNDIKEGDIIEAYMMEETK